MPLPVQPRASLYGAQIRQSRRELGHTLGRFAEAIVDAAQADDITLNLTAGAVCRWENGQTEPALRYRPYIAQVLGVEVRFLFPEIPRRWVA